MRTALRKLGNSSGVVIPKSLLAEAGISVGDLVDMSLDKGRIVLAPVARGARGGWAQAARDIAAEGDDAPVWPEFGNADDQTLTW